MDHIKENLSEANQAEPEMLNDEEKTIINNVKGLYKSRIKVDCTNCKYCMPCPHGVNIPGNFSFYNNAYIFDDIEHYKKQYHGQMKPEIQADACVQCGECEPKCPQNIQIINELVNVAELFRK